MKKEIRLMLDYECYPIWIYDENGDFIDNDLVDEIKKDDKMVSMLEELQNEFESLYLNTKQEFKYIGFSTEVDKHAFTKKVQSVYNALCNLLNDKYIIKNMINFQDM